MSGGINSADGLTEVESTGTGTVTSVSVVTANGFSGSVATATTTPAITLSISSAGILAALAALDAPAVFGDWVVVADKGDFDAPLVAKTVRTADDYSISVLTPGLANDGTGCYGVVLSSTFNGISDTELAARIVDIYNNVEATRGAFVNSSVIFAVLDQVGPPNNFAIGMNYVSSDGFLLGALNAFPILFCTDHVTRAVIGVDGSATFNFGVIFPSADPHIAGAWWDNAGTLTRSSG